MFDDRAGLVGGALGLDQFLEGKEPAVGRRILVEQDLLRPFAGSHVQKRVHPLDGLACHQHGAVEPLGIRLALAQVADDLRAERARRVAEQTELFDDRRGRAAAVFACLLALPTALFLPSPSRRPSARTFRVALRP